MTLTLSELLLATYTRLPSGLTVTPRGRLPTGTVVMTLLVAPSITVTSSDFSFVTKTRSSAPARESPPASAVARRAAVRARRRRLGIVSPRPRHTPTTRRRLRASADRPRAACRSCPCSPHSQTRLADREDRRPD